MHAPLSLENLKLRGTLFSAIKPKLNMDFVREIMLFAQHKGQTESYMKISKGYRGLLPQRFHDLVAQVGQFSWKPED